MIYVSQMVKVKSDYIMMVSGGLIGLKIHASNLEDALGVTPK